nr:recombinase family protein [Pseudovibrio sp. Tun.PSC04-5.I4]
MFWCTAESRLALLHQSFDPAYLCKYRADPVSDYCIGLLDAARLESSHQYCDQPLFQIALAFLKLLQLPPCRSLLPPHLLQQRFRQLVATLCASLSDQIEQLGVALTKLAHIQKIIDFHHSFIHLHAHMTSQPIQGAERGQIDTDGTKSLVWKCDRFARSTRHLLNALEEFDHFGVRFISV